MLSREGLDFSQFSAALAVSEEQKPHPGFQDQLMPGARAGAQSRWSQHLAPLPLPFSANVHDVHLCKGPHHWKQVFTDFPHSILPILCYFKFLSL